MITEHDLAEVLDELAALAPAECASFTPARAAARPVPAPRRRSPRTPDRRRRVRLTIAGLFGVGLAGGGGVLAYSEIATPKVIDDTVVTCYVSTRYGPDTDYATVHEQKNPESPLTHLTDAVATCGELWRRGILPGPPRAGVRVDPHVDHPVPPLTPCIAPDGTVAVFPAPATCAGVGLPSDPPSPTRRSGR